MKTIETGDRIKVTNKQHPVFPGQTGEILSVYTFENMDPACKVRVDNGGPICVIRNENMEVI